MVAAARAAHPDVALLDIEMPGIDGLEAAALLHRALPACMIIILTTFGRPGYLRRAMEAGATGFVVKDGPADQLAVSIRRAVAGERVIDTALAAAALSDGSNPLTPRERDVLHAASAGATIASIAELALPLTGNRAQLPVVGDPEDGRAQPHRGRAHRRATRLAVAGRSTSVHVDRSQPGTIQRRPRERERHRARERLRRVDDDEPVDVERLGARTPRHRRRRTRLARTRCGVRASDLLAT